MLFFVDIVLGSVFVMIIRKCKICLPLSLVLVKEPNDRHSLTVSLISEGAQHCEHSTVETGMG